jgi:Tol biopolymer transport system component
MRRSGAVSAIRKVGVTGATSRIWLAVFVGVLLMVIAAPVGSAWALYTPDMLVSYAGATQAEGATSPAISADGLYVAFSGSFNGVSGVWRKNLESGELMLVAGTDSQDAALSAPDAGAPSISGEGRYVSFTTTKALDPADDPGKGCSSVYVRDTQVPIGQPGAYMLASALNGSSEGIAYAGSSSPGESCPGGGSAAAGRVALSDEHGELKVAFTVIGQSDLTTGVGGAVDTPPAQVAVRDLDTDTTTLVSQTMGSLGSTPQPVPEGGAFSDEAARSPIGASSAAISADGSIVAWLGIEIPSQATASDVLAIDGGDAPYGYPDEYAEPLWREIGDGSDAPTRRVTGGDDPLCGCAGPLATDFDPGLQSPGEDVGPEFGTYIAINSSNLGNVQAFYENITPQLSTDGRKVAFLSTAPDTGEEPIIPGKNYVLSTNAFVANMAPGLSRGQALIRLTGWASDDFNDLASTGPVESIAISPDGTRVAFSTARIDFPLSPPALITPALGQVDEHQLYVANLAAGSLSLVSYGYNGEPANEGVVTPSFSAGGGPLAFASSATNLVYGAYNSNVFVTSEISSPAVAGVQQIGPIPTNPSVAPHRELLAQTQPGPHGSVLVYVSVPGAGTLKASARSEVPVSVAVAAKGKRARKGKRTILSLRVVASARVIATHEGAVELKLRSTRAYQPLVESHDGLYATIGLSFASAGEKTLTSTVQATFHSTPAKPAKKAGRAGANKKAEKARKSAERRSGAKDGSGS